MPYINSIKVYSENSMYHIYARGVNKMNIFKNPEDYHFFKYLLQKYLTKDFKEVQTRNGIEYFAKINTSYEQVELLAYALMKNHFHFLLENITKDGVSNFMRKILSVYAGYFNKKYNREGPLIQGGYRAILVNSDEYLTQLIKYIHLNCVKDKLVKKASDYKYSSYPNYLYSKSTPWLKVKPDIQQGIKWDMLEKYLQDYETNLEKGFI